MAKFRLKSAHQMRNVQLNADAWLPGDKENEHIGDGVEKGTIVGTGTSYPVVSATLEMAPLDDEAIAMIEAEERRLSRNNASMNPIDQLPLTLQQLMGGTRDDYDDRYIPGFAGVPRPQAPPEKQKAS